MSMGKLEYSTDSKYNKEAKKISFEFTDDIDIFQFKTICVRMASAMGYTDGSIKSAFGKEYDGDIEKEFKELLDTVLSGSIEII
jgi:hypothetical protein